jgi:hypothetical protein
MKSPTSSQGRFDSHPVVLCNDKGIYSVQTQHILVNNTINLVTCFGSLKDRWTYFVLGIGLNMVQWTETCRQVYSADYKYMLYFDWINCFISRDGSVQKFMGTERFLGVSRQNTRRKIKRWMDNQHLVMWCGPCSTQRQAWELIRGPDLATRARLLSFRTQTRVVIGILTGHNTLRRYLYAMGLSDNHICRKCDTEEGTSIHVLCVRP